MSDRSTPLKTLAALKQQNKARQQEVAASIKETLLNPKDLALFIMSGIANRLLQRRQKITINKKGLFGTTSRVVEKKNTLLQSVLGVLGNPLVNTILVKSKKAWVGWQVVIIGLFIGKKIYDRFYVKKKEKEEKSLLYQIREVLGI